MRLQPTAVASFMNGASLAGDQCAGVQRAPEDDSYHPWDELRQRAGAHPAPKCESDGQGSSEDGASKPSGLGLMGFT